jgi:hypothetical protein
MACVTDATGFCFSTANNQLWFDYRVLRADSNPSPAPLLHHIVATDTATGQYSGSPQITVSTNSAAHDTGVIVHCGPGANYAVTPGIPQQVFLATDGVISDADIQAVLAQPINVNCTIAVLDLDPNPFTFQRGCTLGQPECDIDHVDTTPPLGTAIITITDEDHGGDVTVTCNLGHAGSNPPVPASTYPGQPSAPSSYYPSQPIGQNWGLGGSGFASWCSTPITFPAGHFLVKGTYAGEAAHQASPSGAGPYNPNQSFASEDMHVNVN